MRVYTAQKSVIERHPEKVVGRVIDTTAAKNHLLSPVWKGLVKEYKAGRMSDEAYEQRYVGLLRDRYRANPQAFVELLQQDEATLTCFCRAGHYCHRHLAVQVLEKIAAHHAIPFEYGGEIT